MSPIDQRYKSILTICIGFMVLFFFFEQKWMYYLALSVGVLALISTRLALSIQTAWEYLGKALGYVNSRIILSLVYFLLVIPMSIVYRISKNKTMKLRRSEHSYWVERNHLYIKGDMDKSW